MLIDTLAATLLGNLLAGKGAMRASERAIRPWEGKIREDQGS